MNIEPYCPRDTDGDGNCGQKQCPYCGEDRMKILYPLVCAVAGEMAADVWDEKTVVEHADAVAHRPLAARHGEFVAGALFRLIAEQFNYSSVNGDGSYTPITFLEHLHTVWGYNHLTIIDNLRDLAAEIDPRADERTYGKARDRGRTR